jgi:hypothetical protein
VTAALVATTGTGKLAGTHTIVTDAAGLATYTDLAITKGGLYALKFSSGALTPLTSTSIIVF